METDTNQTIFTEFGPKVPAQTIPWEALESARQSMTRELMKIADSYVRKGKEKRKSLQ
jgi:hypothetical protein